MWFTFLSFSYQNPKRTAVVSVSAGLLEKKKQFLCGIITQISVSLANEHDEGVTTSISPWKFLLKLYKATEYSSCSSFP